MSLSIRSIGIRDIASFRKLRRAHVALNYPEVALYHPYIDVLATMPYGRRFWRAYLASIDGQSCALVALQPEPREFRWVVTGLSAGGGDLLQDEDERIEVWSQLLMYAARAAGLANAKRLHVSAPEEGPAFEALIRAGFNIYSNQTLMLARGLHHEEHDDVHVREQEPADAWSIHQLYHLATPRAIQYAEALTSNHWDVGRKNGSRVRGYLIEREQDVAAHCRVMSRGHQYSLDVVAQQNELHLLPELVSHSMRAAGVGARDEVWTAVPDYRGEYVDVLQQLGFEVVARQVQMVRYAAFPVRPVLARWRGTVPEVGAKVPSYSAARHEGRC